MLNNIIHRLTYCASAMSFFGYIYEAIDFVPNYFGSNPTATQIAWTQFHHLTNPAFYHIPAALITFLGLGLLWINHKNYGKISKKNLKKAIIAMIITNILTVIAVTQINNKLYFGEPITDIAFLHNLVILWGTLNILRILATGYCTLKISNP